MNIAIFGTGYVGLVTGACLAEVGNHVVCVDVNDDKIESLKRGQVPIFEPGLDEIVLKNIEIGTLTFTTEVPAAVQHGLFQFIAVGTPPDEDGSADLKHVLDVAKGIGKHISDYRIVVTKSTVPVGTADKVDAAIREQLQARGEDIEFDVVSNPEFLKEGAAVEDFLRPDRIVVGTDNPRTAELLRILYSPFTRNHDRMVLMDVRSAELTKYAANAMLATKISFMNELANLAERVGADIERVRLGIGSDPRIGYQFIYPGCGYGGSCFPKDVKALNSTAVQIGCPSELLAAVESVNERQKRSLFEKIRNHFGGDLENKVFAVWGLAFKPNTDDMREAPSRVLMEQLWASGARVRAFDPKASDEARRIYGERPDLEHCDSHEEALAGANALVITTEWNIFRSPDFEALRKNLKDAVIFDGRNLYDPSTMSRMGFTYYGVGRGQSVEKLV